MENENAAIEAEQTAPESAPEEQNTVEEPMNDSEVEETPQEDSAEEDANVPLHENPRFKEVYSEMKTYKEELAQMKEQLAQAQPAPVAETPYTPPTAPAELPEWVMNEDGEILPDKFLQYSAQTATEAARAEMNRAKTEETVWAETYKEYPQLKDDAELKSIVENGAYAEYIRTGKAVHPKEYAKRVFDRFAEKKQEGARIAQSNAEIVKGAYLEPNSPASNRERTLTNADLARADGEQILKWQESGEIDRALQAGTIKGQSIA